MITVRISAYSLSLTIIDKYKIMYICIYAGVNGNDTKAAEAPEQLPEHVLAAAQRFSEEALGSMPALLEGLGKALRQARSERSEVKLQLLVQRMIGAIKVESSSSSESLRWVEEVEARGRALLYRSLEESILGF